MIAGIVDNTLWNFVSSDRVIPCSNLDLHVAHCSRKLEKCKICGDVVPKKHAEEHFLSTHAPVSEPICLILSFFVNDAVEFYRELFPFSNYFSTFTHKEFSSTYHCIDWSQYILVPFEIDTILFPLFSFLFASRYCLCEYAHLSAIGVCKNTYFCSSFHGCAIQKKR